jgi:uncharacterized membrane protein YcaP (DUF421 family)
MMRLRQRVIISDVDLALLEQTGGLLLVDTLQHQFYADVRAGLLKGHQSFLKMAEDSRMRSQCDDLNRIARLHRIDWTGWSVCISGG